MNPQNATTINSYKQTIFIQKQQNLINEFKEYKNNKFLQTALSNIKQHQFAYVIFLHKYEFFKSLCAMDYIQSGKQAQIRLEIFAWIQFIFPGFFAQIKQHKAANIIKQKQYEKIKQQITKNKLNLTRIQIYLIDLFKLMLIIRKQKGKNSENINKSIQISLNLTVQQDKFESMCYQQVACNYLLLQIQTHRKSALNTKRICCKLIFQNDQILESTQDQFQQFKRYTWPIKNTHIQNHIAKTITGYMNCNGGIIYIGIYEDKQKKNKVIGINLTQAQRKQVIRDFIRYVSMVNPYHYGFEDIDNKEDNQYRSDKKSKANQAIINDYVRIQFLPIAKPKILTYVHQRNSNNQITKTLYVVKIIVKIGHPKHLYHLINGQKSIDFYERKENKVEKKLFPDAYRLIYERLDRFEEIKKFIIQQTYKRVLQYQNNQKSQLNEQQKSKYYNKQRKKLIRQILQEIEKEKSAKLQKRAQFHNGCQYKMDIKKLLLKEDITSLEEQFSVDEDEDEDKEN